MAARPAPALVAGNVYDKYRTRHPITRRLMAGFERSMFELLATTRPVATVLEVGCGEGMVTAQLTRFFPGAQVVGCDLSPQIVAEARQRHPGLRFEVASIYDAGTHAGSFDLVVACEVLEHLEDPARALRAIARASNRHLFVSVPREPLWRLLNLARGRYWSRLGNTPGHLRHWSTGAFVRLLGTEVEVRATRSPIPWTQALCRVRR
jgi:2-polyprenyl-3-methyl-5-hydroxy-6-metoxy-1,4-benzoquinol methylase